MQVCTIIDNAPIECPAFFGLQPYTRNQAAQVPLDGASASSTLSNKTGLALVIGTAFAIAGLTVYRIVLDQR